MQEQVSTSYETSVFRVTSDPRGVWSVTLIESGELLAEGLSTISDLVLELSKLDVTVGERKGQRSFLAGLAHRLEQEKLVEMSPEEYSKYCDECIGAFVPYKSSKAF